MARTKKLELEPEQICDRIVAFDPELCDATFLFELQPVLPTPEQVCHHGSAFAFSADDRPIRSLFSNSRMLRPPTSFSSSIQPIVS